MSRLLPNPTLITLSQCTSHVLWFHFTSIALTCTRAHALTRWSLSAWKITNYSLPSTDLIIPAWTEMVHINQMCNSHFHQCTEQELRNKYTVQWQWKWLKCQCLRSSSTLYYENSFLRLIETVEVERGWCKQVDNVLMICINSQAVCQY